MRALQVDKFGPPLKVVQLKELSVAELKPNEVRIKMKYCPINPSDILFIMGQYGIKGSPPIIPGFEGMGVIESLGSEVSHLKKGMRVIPIGYMGTWQEYITTTKDQVMIIPEGLKDESAAQLIVNPMTAWILTMEELNLQDGQWLLQTAAGSTLGRLVIQLAKLKGFKTINLVRRREQVQELLDLGADSVICTLDKDVVEQVMKLTKHGVDGAIDAVGGKTGSIASKCLRRGAKLIVYGLLSLSNRTPIDTGEMIFKGTTIKGFWLTRWYQDAPPDEQKRIMKDLIAEMIQGSIEPSVEAIYPLEDYKRALEHSTKPGRTGKLLFSF